MTQTVVRAYDVNYPDGCKEVSDDIRPDELRKRLKDIWKSLLNLAEPTELSHEDSLLNSSTSGVGSANFPDFRGLAFYLSSEQFTEHSDGDIRLRVACCLCAIIKLYCPESPFEGMTDAGGLLKRILLLFADNIRSLSAIKSKEDPQFMKLYALFSTCSHLDIFVWCRDADDGSDVLMKVFKAVFQATKNMEIWAWTAIEKVKHLILDMLSNLIVQNESILTQEIINFLLRFLMDPAKTAQPNQSELARDLLLRNTAHFEYWIHMIIQSALLNAEGSQEFVPEDVQSGTSGASAGRSPGAEFGDHVYSLIYELHTLQDSLIKPILPSLAVKLKSNETKNRKRSVRLLARLFGENESTLHRTQGPLWEAFLGRFNDIEAPVRELCVRLVPQMVRSNNDLAEPLLAAVGERAKDLQESVRDLAVKVVAEMLKDNAVSAKYSQLMDILIDRARDKVISIRKEAASQLASIYRRMVTRDIDSDCSTECDRDFKQATTILNTIMHLYYQNRVEDNLFFDLDMMLQIGNQNFSDSFPPLYDLVIHTLKGSDGVIAALLMRVCVERLFKSSLVPYTQPTDERMKSLLRFYGALDEHSVKAFNELMKTQFFLMTLLRQIVNILVENQGKKIAGDVNILLMEKLSKLTAHLQNPDKSLDFLKRFFNHVHEDKGLRQLLVKLTAPECACNRATDYLKDILRRVNMPVSRGGSGGGGNDAYQNCIRILLERSAQVILDREAAQELVSLLVVVRDSPDAIMDLGHPFHVETKKGLNLLLALTLYVKEVMCLVDDVVDYLLPILEGSEDEVADNETQIVSLQLLHNLCAGGIYAGNKERFGDVQEQLLAVLQLHAVPQRTRSVVEILSARRRCKYAIMCLHALSVPATSPYGGREENDDEEEEEERPDDERHGSERIRESVEEVVDVCVENAEEVPALCALGHVALLLPGDFGNKLKSLISRHLIPRVVMKDPSNGAIPKEPLSTWLSDESVSTFTWLRMETLKLMTRWLVGLQTDDKVLSNAIMKLLYTVILSHGDINRKGNLRAGEMSRLRLTAAKCWLRLAQQRCYVDTVETAWFQTMARIAADPCAEVRSGFLKKLHRGLLSLRLPLEYLGIFALTASVDDAQFKNLSKSHLAANVQARKDFLSRNRSFSDDPKRLYALLPDYVLPYALHLLAHDPGWKMSEDTAVLAKMKAALWFLLEPIIVKGDNFSFLRKMLEKMKHAKDALAPNDTVANAKLYALCDIALGLVMTKSSNLVLKEYPVEPALPSRLYVRAERGFLNPEFNSLATGAVHFSPPKGAAGQRALEQRLIPSELLKKKSAPGGVSETKKVATVRADVDLDSEMDDGKVSGNSQLQGKFYPDNSAAASRKRQFAPSSTQGKVYPVTNNVGSRKRPVMDTSPQPPTRMLTGPEDSESEPEDVVRFTPTKRRRVDSPAHKLMEKKNKAQKENKKRQQGKSQAAAKPGNKEKSERARKEDEQEKAKSQSRKPPTRKEKTQPEKEADQEKPKQQPRKLPARRSSPPDKEAAIGKPQQQLRKPPARKEKPQPEKEADQEKPKQQPRKLPARRRSSPPEKEAAVGKSRKPPTKRVLTQDQTQKEPEDSSREETKGEEEVVTDTTESPQRAKRETKDERKKEAEKVKSTERAETPRQPQRNSSPAIRGRRRGRPRKNPPLSPPRHLTDEEMQHDAESNKAEVRLMRLPESPGGYTATSEEEIEAMSPPRSPAPKAKARRAAPKMIVAIKGKQARRQSASPSPKPARKRESAPEIAAAVSRSSRSAKSAATSLMLTPTSNGSSSEVTTVFESPVHPQSSGNDADVSSQESKTSSSKKARPKIMEDVPEDKSWPLRKRAGSSENEVRELLKSRRRK